MAMQSGAMAVSEEIPWYSHQQPMDERDGFLMWLRGEFAAANVIIDALCHHLQAVGDPGEYDAVIGCIQQRRINWNAVLHMQQYFSVAEVICALQHAGWKRQQRAMGFDGGARKEYRRGGRGQRGGAEAQSLGNEVNGQDLNVHVKHSVNENGKVQVDESLDVKAEKGKNEAEENKELDGKFEISSSKKSQENIEGIVAHMKENTGHISADVTGLSEKLEKKDCLTITPKNFVATEIYDGESVNVVDGMKLYENLYDESEVSNLSTLVNDLRNSGRRGQLKGQTFTILKRPMKGRGRETIQLGFPFGDASHEEEATSGTSKELEIDPIPVLLRDVIERLPSVQAVTIKPDSCIIDFFHEGDHSQPYIWPQWFGRPICILFLTMCDMSFGKVIRVDHPGDYRGALQLTLSPGSVLVMEGKAADFARHAIPSQRKHRILVTLAKSQPNKFTSGDIHRFPSAVATPSHWIPPPSRSPNHIRPVAAKHFGSIPTTGVPHAPTTHPRLPLPNGMQPIYVPPPVAAAMTFPAPVALTPASAGWTPTPRHPPPRLPVSGTGVFLPPPGSGGAPNHLASTQATENIITVPSSQSETADGLEISNCTSTSQKVDNEVHRQESTGSIHRTPGKIEIEKQEQDENLDLPKSSGAV